jgi:hypothetical protein
VVYLYMTMAAGMSGRVAVTVKTPLASVSFGCAAIPVHIDMSAPEC